MDMVQRAEFHENVADRHGGVIWADHDTAAETYNEFLLHSTTYIDPSRPCCIRFGNEAGIPGQHDIVQKVINQTDTLLVCLFVCLFVFVEFISCYLEWGKICL